MAFNTAVRPYSCGYSREGVSVNVVKFVAYMLLKNIGKIGDVGLTALVSTAAVSGRGIDA